MSSDVSLGYLILVQSDADASPLPLERTSVTGEVIGGAATVRVMQQFGNPFTHPIEVEYVFPLPHKAAIHDYAVTVGGRVIKADMRERGEAERTYREAQAEGKRASLLEQQRPNLFTIRIANVQPGESIRCELAFDDVLVYKDGAYEFVFPMGITPRYHTPSLPYDASVDAPLAAPEARIAPVDITLTLLGDAGQPVSKSHPITVQPDRAGRTVITLAGDHIPNKDFVLRLEQPAGAITSRAWAALQDDGSEIALLDLLPPRSEGEAVPGKREFIFVFDRSGSMGGSPIVQARDALKTCLRMLGSDDTFVLLVFDDKIDWFTHNPQPITQERIDAADKWIEKVNARGGTEIMGAITAALTLPVDPERTRYVIFLTDGAVSAENEAISTVLRGRGQARIFTFGLGASVNRYLLEKMAVRGAAEFLGLNDDIEKAITRFQDRISYPALTDIQLEWGGAQVWDTYPETLSDLYIGQPLTLITRLMRSAAGSTAQSGVTVRGLRGGEHIEFSTPIPAGDHPLLGRLWARARLESLLDQAQYQNRDVRQEVITLALKHRLVSPYTSFVAVDTEVTTGGKDELVRVAVPLPEGLRYESFLEVDARRMCGAAAGGRVMARKGLPSPSSGTLQDNLSFQAFAQPAPAAYFAQPEFERAITLEPPDPLKQLARTQKINGSWDDDIAKTAAALLTFVQAGHTTQGGDYRRQVSKAAAWLREAIKHGGDSDAFRAANDALVALHAAENRNSGE